MQKLPEYHQPRLGGDRVVGRFEFERENRLAYHEVAPFVAPFGWVNGWLGHLPFYQKRQGVSCFSPCFPSVNRGSWVICFHLKKNEINLY
jgi:hypothetical protein